MKRQENLELTKLETGITFLATTGSTCPFIGLFGTVLTGFIAAVAVRALQTAVDAPN